MKDIRNPKKDDEQEQSSKLDKLEKIVAKKGLKVKVSDDGKFIKRTTLDV